MNICILTPRYYPNTPGGGARSCHLIAKELQKRVNVEVISFDAEENQSSELEGVPVQRIKPASSEKTLLNLQSYNHLKRQLSKFDLIHTYNMDLMPSLGLISSRFGVPSVATLNGTIYTRINEWYYRWTKNPYNLRHSLFSVSLLSRNVIHKEIVKKIQRFTALCQFRKETFMHEGFPGDKISVITNLLDTERQITAGEKLGEKVNIVYLGTDRWRKGLDILLEAYRRLEKQDVKLTLAGVGDQGKYQAKVEEIGIPNEVTVHGRLPYEETGSLLAGSDMLIFPLRFPEPVGRVLIEGMQQGLCVIATGTDEYSPIIEDGKSGALVNPSNPEKYAEKIQFLLDNPDLLGMMKRNAKERVEDVCKPEGIAGQYIELYENTI
jgi:glycosyltransferase involved in cell wall biosynthesis